MIVKNFRQRIRNLSFVKRFRGVINNSLYIDVLDTAIIDENFKSRVIVEALLNNSNILYVTKEFKDGIVYGAKEDVEKVLLSGQFDTAYNLNNNGITDKQKEEIDTLIIDDNLGYLDLNTSYFKKKKIIILNKKV